VARIGGFNESARKTRRQLIAIEACDRTPGPRAADPDRGTAGDHLDFHRAENSEQRDFQGMIHRAHLTHSLKMIHLVIDTPPTGPQEERALAAPFLIEVNDLRGGLKQDLEYPLDPPIHQPQTDRQNGQGDTLQNIDNELFSHPVVTALALAETKK
jgi:hypothetical protein